MFILHLPHAVFIFSVELSSFALTWKARTVLHNSYRCTQFFTKTVTRIWPLPFTVNAILNLTNNNENGAWTQLDNVQWNMEGQREIVILERFQLSVESNFAFALVLHYYALIG